MPVTCSKRCCWLFSEPIVLLLAYLYVSHITIYPTFGWSHGIVQPVKIGLGRLDGPRRVGQV